MIWALEAKATVTAMAMTLVLLAAFFVAFPSASAYHNATLTTKLDKDEYTLGEVVELSGTINQFRENVQVTIEIYDPNDQLYLSNEVLPTAMDNIALFYYKFLLSEDAPAGIWTIKLMYQGQYMLYAKDVVTFRASASIEILTSPFLKVSADGIIDTASGEWAYKRDTKYFRPFAHNPLDIEDNVQFNAYYINGVLYGIFDVPDKKYDSKDFIEIGLDIDNVADEFKVGDDVYIFRVF
ncbi:MAG: hypothetical protein ACE5KA_09235, partial [Nitrososphaerales archaeon]